ncbi:hypothetical protein [Celeribacter persicus]|jgi:hypothetical protein|uniref:Nickel transport protein n=1 Tax=Celeribacter persicus TaxID=1651082 RepID=A0A2T5HJZ8_9RHOB|nr:hypothetical protein [Celeribacter persicus]PTQ71894.1 hypothetical protein C8N42_10773 [Celeribacter persicus]
MLVNIGKNMALAGGFALTLVAAAYGHTPVCACYDNGDGTVLCEGGFSDGSSAAGVAMIVHDADGNVLLEGVINENGEFEFEKPDGFSDVLFDGGEGHRITIPADDIY